ncbi:MAG: MFS transporter [Verrucomicrobia bacterium]|nr:MFS transporter [Verrucomicrobiota bacterium]
MHAFRIWLDRLAQSPNYKWVVVGLLFFSGFLNLEDRVVIFSVMPLIRQELTLSDFQIGALMTAFLWTYALSSPFAGFFGDRVARKRILVGCLILWSLVTFAVGLVTSAGQLVAARVLLAITEAFYIPASLAIVADYHTKSTRAKAVAVLVIGMNLGPILGGAAAGWIGDHYGWRPVLLILGGIGILLASVQFVFLREVAMGASDAAAGKSYGTAVPLARPVALGATIRELLGTPSYVLMVLSVGIVAIGVWMLITWLPLFLVETFKMSLAQSGFWGNLAITGSVFISALAGGALSDFVGAKQPRRRMLLMVVFYALVLPWPLLFFAAKSVTVVLVSIFLFQLCRGMAELNSFPLIYELVPPDKRSTAVGISNCVNTIFGGGGALVVGYFKSSLGFQTVFGLVPAMIAISVGCLLIGYLKFLPRDLARRGAVAPAEPS